jgi:serine phosphatase RsbU (regulator of sigma subunit)
VIDPSLDRAQISLAGHFPPIVASPGRPAVLADIETDLLIGAAPGVERRAATVKVPPGMLLCFYTDGLIERRGQPLDDSLARFREVVTAGPPETVCATVMSRLIGGEPARDDVALLVFRRNP